MPQGQFETTVRRTDLNAAFSTSYVEKCFLLWYKSGRLPFKRLIELLPEDDLGRRPATNKIDQWRSQYGWNERADILDAEVARRIEARAIEEKVEMLNRHAEAGRVMVEKALEYVQTHDISKMDTAVKMLVQGVQIEQASRGIPTALLKIAEMDNDSIMAMATKLMTSNNPDDVTKMLMDAAKPDAVEAEFEETSNAH